MTQRIVIDPITRIEGHLRIEAQVEGGKITKAYSSTMYRGIEMILKGRDPRDAQHFTQRVCGVCTTVHSIASIRCVEDALQIQIPDNARLLRNLIMAAAVHPGPCDPFLSSACPGLGRCCQRDEGRRGENIPSGPEPLRVAEIVAPITFKASRTEFPPSWTAASCRHFPERLLGAPGLQAPSRGESDGGGALSGGFGLAEGDDQDPRHSRRQKSPSATFLVGGMPYPIDPSSQNALNAHRIAHLRKLFRLSRQFVDQVYIPDLLAIASFYKEWAQIGGGVGNFLYLRRFSDG